MPELTYDDVYSAFRKIMLESADYGEPDKLARFWISWVCDPGNHDTVRQVLVDAARAGIVAGFSERYDREPVLEAHREKSNE